MSCIQVCEEEVSCIQVCEEVSCIQVCEEGELYPGV